MSETPEPPQQPEPSAHSPLPWKACAANKGKCTCGMIWDATGDLHVASVMGPNNAAAAQRAEAFLKTLSLWKDEP